MSLRRLVGVAAAVVVAAGAGLLLSSGTGVATTPAPTPITLAATGMSSTSCPLPLNGSMAVVPNTTVQFKPGLVLSLGQSMTLTLLSKANTTPAPTPKTYSVPSTGITVPFVSAQAYDLTWRTSGVLGFTQHGQLIISSSVQSCRVVVQVPVPSLSASAVPSPIISAINGGLGGVASTANGLLSPVNSALPTVPPLPTGLPTVPVPGVPLPGHNPPGATPSPGVNAPGTIYQPHGPTVADRTVPKGYGNGSGLGGSYVAVTGNSITAPAQQSLAGNGKQAGKAGSSAAAPARSGRSPKTVELASNRPRSALGALPTLAVILAIVALSGATAFYARTFLLQPAQAKVPVQLTPKSTP
jgi:hypothetical protein